MADANAVHQIVEEGCMAQGIDFSCSNCGMTVGSWDDGNPYYIDRHKMVLKDLPRSKCKVYVTTRTCHRALWRAVMYRICASIAVTSSTSIPN
jgi:hypothetical protein